MTLALRQESEHPSAHALDLFQVGALDEPSRAAIAAHLDGCASCSALLQEARAAQAAFSAAHDRDSFLLAVRQRAEQGPDRSWRALAWWVQPRLALATGAIAALILLAFWMLPQQAGPGSGLRMKGRALELSFLVEENGRPVLAAQDRVLHPGDRVQFRLTAPKGGFVHLVGVDSAGQVSVYYPGDDGGVEAFPGGAGRPLPSSVILDETLGRERVFALVCQEPLRPAQLLQTMRAAHQDLRVWIDRPELPFNCRQTSLLLVKE